MRFITAIWFILTAKCNDATHAFSDEFDGLVSGSEWWAGRLHLMACGNCRRFRKQLVLLERLFAAMPAEWRKRLLDDQPKRLLSPELAQRLRRAIEQAEQSENN